jgi:hypothetical protein
MNYGNMDSPITIKNRELSCKLHGEIHGDVTINHADLMGIYWDSVINNGDLT